MADKRDASIQNTIVYPRGLNICPLMPWIVVRGINTTQVVSVPPTMDMTTMLVPSSAAFAYSINPFSLYSSVALKQLSSTTMELSTIMPTPRTRALIVMIFKENPALVSAIKASRMEVGMELPTISDAFQSPKNRKMIAMEMMTASTMVSATSERESTMESAVSLAMVISRSGSSISSASMASFTASDTSMAELSCCFVMEMEMVSCPLYLDAPPRSLVSR